MPSVQINTGGACHLDGNMIRGAFEHISFDDIDLLVVENVGNLVCPAEFNVGEHHKVMMLSVAEGADKPEKYPLMFRESTVLLLNKVDLGPYVDFDQELMFEAVRKVNDKIDIMPVSCRSQEGLDAWFAWLDKGLAENALEK